MNEHTAAAKLEPLPIPFSPFKQLPDEWRGRAARSRLDALALREDWRKDPEFDLARHAAALGGYEPFLEELTTFEQEQRARWDREQEERKQRAAEKLVEARERRIRELGFITTEATQFGVVPDVRGRNLAIATVALEQALDRLTAAVERVADTIANDPRRI